MAFGITAHSVSPFDTPHTVALGGRNKGLALSAFYINFNVRNEGVFNMSIPKGCTPVHEFSIPFDASNVKAAKITYKQQGVVLLKKETDDCEITENTIRTELSQEETFLFNEEYPVKIQLRVLDINDKAFKTDVMTVTVEECLDDEVLE